MARKSAKRNFILVALALIILSAALSACAQDPADTRDGVDIMINFEVDGAVYKAVELNTQGQITLPPDPVKEGYVFGGWFLEKTYSKKLTNYIIRTSSENFTVYALFEHKTHIGEWRETEKADCIKAGLRQNICKICGIILDSETIAPLGHTIEEGETSCSVCNETNPSTVGLAYVLNSSRDGYLAAGPGSSTERNIVLAEKYNGLPVTGVADNAFSGNTALLSVYFTEDVAKIGDNAFYGCTGLTALNLPENLETIGQRAFYGCSGLTALAVPENVASVGEAAFGGCTNLVSAAFSGDKLTCFADKLFAGNSRLVSITYPEALETIGKEVFSGCVRLAETTLPDTIIEIGDRAFSGCELLSDILFGENLAKIGSRAFLNCVQLTALGIPLTVTQIGEEAFLGCTALTSVSIPAVVAGNYGATNIERVILTAEEDSDAVVREGAFRNLTSLTSVEFSEFIAEIGAYAFQNCRNLDTITCDLINRIKSIGAYAFANCSDLASYTFGNYTDALGAGAFSGCTRLTSISLPFGLKKIEANVFSGCSALNSVTFADNITQIGDNAFSGCSALSAISIPASLEKLGAYAFSDSALVSVNLPGSILAIGKSAFSGCSALRTVIADNVSYRLLEEMPEDFTENYAKYYRQGGMGYVPLNKAYDWAENTYYAADVIGEIGDNAFRNCSVLTEIRLHPSLTYIGNYAFFGCNNLPSFTIGKEVEHLGEGVFALCGAMTIAVNAENTHFVIEDKVLYEYETVSGQIAYRAIVRYMSDKSDTDFLVPLTVNRIYDYAFDNVSSLGALYVHDRVTKVGYQNVASSVKVYCEASAKPSGWAANFMGQNANIAWSCNKDKAHFEYTLNGDTYTVSKYIGNGTEVAVPMFYNGKLVTEIGAETFKDAVTLYVITVHEKIAVIAENAFENCASLYSIEIDDKNPNYLDVSGVLFDIDMKTLIKYPSLKTDDIYLILGTVTRVAHNAFENCASLSTLVVPSSVSEMKEANGASLHIYFEANALPANWNGSTARVVFDCYKDSGDFSYRLVGETYAVSNYTGSAGDVIIPVSYNGTPITEIFAETFRDIPIMSVEIPNTVKIIGTSAFENCAKLTEVYIPAGVILGERCFAGCASLVSVVIPAGVTSIPDYAFAYCTSLAGVTLPEGLVTIGAYAFEYCALEAITLPTSLEEIGISAFSCNDLSNITIPEKVGIISAFAFEENALLLSVTIKGLITEIGEGAFSGDVSLSSIDLPYTVSKIGGNAFAGTALTSISLPDRVRTIGSYAFANMQNLTSVILPAYLENVGIGILQGSRNLVSLSFRSENDDFLAENNVLYNKAKTVLYVYAPAKADTTFAVPQTVTEIVDGAFYSAKNLMGVTLGNNLTKIGKYAFYGCDKITSITIPNKVTEISNGAFDGCLMLANVTFGENLAVIGEYAFRGTRVTTLVFPSKLVEIKLGAFYACAFLTSIADMPAVTKIGEDAFGYCTALRTLTLPRSLTDIGTRAFRNCDLRNITIPLGVARMGARVFEGCSQLSVINCETSSVPVGWNATWNEDVSALILYGEA